MGKMRIDEARLSFQGTRVRFRVYTPDITPPAHRALFVSSPIGDADSWDALCQALTQGGCLCVATDLPGFGKNPGGGAPQDNDTRSQILWGILDEVEKQRGEAQGAWHLVGHGSAGAAVLCMALYQSGSALSRVLISPVLERFMVKPLQNAVKTRAGEALVTAWYRWNIENKKRFRKLAARVYGQSPSGERLSALHHGFTRRGSLPVIKRALQEGYQLPGVAYGLEGPLMLLWGAEDRIFGGQIPARIARRLPNAEKHLVRAAHMSMETHPDVICDYLRGWFRFAEGREKTVIKPSASKPQGKR